MPRIPVYDSSNNLTKESPQTIVNPEIYAQKGRNFQEAGKGFSEIGEKIQKIDDVNRKAYALSEHDRQMTELEMERAQKGANFTQDDYNAFLKKAGEISKNTSAHIGSATDKAEFNLLASKSFNDFKVKMTTDMFKAKADSTKASVDQFQKQILEAEAIGKDTTLQRAELAKLKSQADEGGLYSREEAFKRDDSFEKKTVENKLDNEVANLISSGDKTAVQNWISNLSTRTDVKIDPETRAKYAKSALNDLSNWQKSVDAQVKQSRIDSIMSTGALVVSMAKNGYDNKAVQELKDSKKLTPEQVLAVEAMKTPFFDWKSPERKSALSKNKNAQAYKNLINAQSDPESLAQAVDVAIQDFTKASEGSIDTNDLIAIMSYADDRMNSIKDPKWDEFDTAVQALRPFGPTAMKALMTEWDKQPGTVKNFAQNIAERYTQQNIPSSILMKDKELPSAGMKNGALKQGTGLPSKDKADVQISGNWYETPKGEKKFVPNTKQAKDYAESMAWKPLEENNADQTGTGSGNNGSTVPGKPKSDKAK